MTPQDRSLAQLLREYPDAALVLSDDGRVLWGNETAETFFNQTLDQAIGVSVLPYIHPNDLELVLRSFESVQTKRVGNPIEIRAKVKDSWRLIETIGVPVGWYQPGAVLFSFRDLTDRRRFEVARDDVARFRSLVQNASIIMLLISPSGVVDSVSGAITRLLGHDPEAVENQPLAALVAEEDRPALQATIEEALRGSSTTGSVAQSLRLLHRDGITTTAYELSMVNLVDDPTVQGLVVSANDVSARSQAEDELQDALVRLHETYSLLTATLDSTADGLLVIDRQRRISSYNKQFTAMWRLPEPNVEWSNDLDLIAYVQDQLKDPPEFLSRIEELYSQPDIEGRDILRFKDGRVFDRFSKPQYLNDVAVGRVWSFRDITEQKLLEDDLSHLAFHDTLTGLANRALLRDRLNQAIARNERLGTYVAVLFLDLDNFKKINDSGGHSAGDELLKAVAERLKGCLRHSDTAARLGGDEFAVLIEEARSHDEVISLTNRIMNELRRPVATESQQVSVTASIGISFGITGSTSEQLLHNADLAMYLAKAQGGDRYEEFHDHMYTTAAARIELERDLRRAVIDHEFRIHFQPIVDLDTNSVVGFEVLVRWLHPTRGLLAPAEFIPVAEEIGLIDSIGAFTLTAACNQVRSWQDQGLAGEDLLISVNLSAREFADTHLAINVRDVLDSTRFNPSNLILEVTESAVMRDPDAALRTLRTLKALGLQIAIDDFGTGYTSLAHLNRLPIDILKIDKSFVGTAVRGDRPDLCRAIVQLAHTLGLSTIAEGVEQGDHVEHLRAIHCNLAQGYYLGVPLSAPDTENYLRNEATNPAP